MYPDLGYFRHKLCLRGIAELRSTGAVVFAFSSLYIKHIAAEHGIRSFNYNLNPRSVMWWSACTDRISRAFTSGEERVRKVGTVKENS